MFTAINNEGSCILMLELVVEFVELFDPIKMIVERIFPILAIFFYLNPSPP